MKRLFTVMNLLKKFNDLRSVEDIYNKIAESIAIDLNIEKCVISLVDREKGMLEAKPPGYGSTVDKILNFKFDVSINSAFKYISKEKEAYYSNDAPNDPFFFKKFIDYFNIKKVIIAPLLVKGDVIGAIYAANAQKGRDFTDEDKIIFDSIGEMIALTINNYQLLKKNEEQLILLDNIRKITNSITSILDYDILLPTILQRIKALFSADAISIMSFKEGTEKLYIRSSVGLSFEYTKNQVIDVSEIDKVRFGKPFIIEDLRENPFGIKELVIKEGLFSTLVVPLKVYDDFVGVLNIYSKKEEHRFVLKDIEKALIISTSVAIAIKNANMFTDIEETVIDVISTISKIVEAKDKYTEKHSESVAEIAVRIGRRLNLQREELHNLYVAGLLHDIGKIGIPDHILQKPSSLTEEEMQVVKTHPTVGAEIIGHIRKLKPAKEAILYHHERYDGNGYPEGKKGKETPLIARILSVADAYEAMTSDRPYHKGLKKEKAVRELIRNKGKQFDPELVDILIELIGI